MEVNNGVKPEVLRAARHYESALGQENPKRPPEMSLEYIDQLNEHDARFVINNVLLPRLRTEEEASNNNNNIRPLRRTRLSLHRVSFTPEGLQVLTNTFRNSSIPLTSLKLFIADDDPQYRLILESLHANTTVKELTIRAFGDNETNVWIAQLLWQKTDFSALSFDHCWSSFNDIFAGLGRGGYTHLRKLSFCRCNFRDADVERLVRALVGHGNHSQLEELDLSHNLITSEGLGFLCALAPSVCPYLKALLLRCNSHLLDNEATVQRFADAMLMADDAVLEKLDIQYCTLCPEGYIIIIKSLEINRMIHWLDLNTSFIMQRLRNQLIESLPKMKKLKHLTCHGDLCNENDQELITAYRKNTSLFTVSLHGIGQVRMVCKRNKFLFHIQNLMDGRTDATTTTTTTNRTRRHRPTVSEPSGQWMCLLEQAGQGPEGASPVFQILRGALGNWWSQSSNSSTTTSTTTITTNNGAAHV